MNSVTTPPPIRVRISDTHRALAWAGLLVVGLTAIGELRLWRNAADVGHPPGFFAFGWVTVQRLLTYGGLAPLVIACKLLLLVALAYGAIVTRGFGSVVPNLEAPLHVASVVGVFGGVPLVLVALIVVFNAFMWTLVAVVTIAIMLALGAIMLVLVLGFWFFFLKPL
jgi:hypothetical protein